MAARVEQRGSRASATAHKIYSHQQKKWLQNAIKHSLEP